MAFKFLDIIPKEHGAWAILLVPYLSGTFASGKPGVPAFLLLVCVISLYLLRGCAEFYLSNLIKKKRTLPKHKVILLPNHFLCCIIFAHINTASILLPTL